MSQERRTQIPSFEEVVRFHGHKCPGLALGYRAALIAMSEVKASESSGDEEMVAILENDACGIDAFLQRQPLPP
jgi:formylmethanofuran dehydrogenase subunit E